MPENNENSSFRPKRLRKMTKNRLQNIALYYLERFDSSVSNLRQVLKKRVWDYARQTPDFDVNEAQNWIDEIVRRCEELGYINDNRYAEFKVDNYLAAGKPERYIRQKMQQKGIDEAIIDSVLQNKDFDEEEMAMRFAAKKKIGPYQEDEEKRIQCRQKDLAALVRAGFGYEIAKKIIGTENIDDFA